MHTYVDETKAKGYVLVAATTTDQQLKVARKEVGTLLLPGQRSLHMKDERAARQHAIADAVVTMGQNLGIEVTVYDAGRDGSELDRRARCLDAVMVGAAAAGKPRCLTLDRDETLVRWDRQQLIEIKRAYAAGHVQYVHASRHEDLLLCIPDVVAWSWAKGGAARKRVMPVIVDVVRVP